MTDLLLNRASLIAFASATAEPAAGLQLRSVLKPLWELRAAPLAQRHRTAHERDLTERLRRRLRAVPPTALRPDLRSLHDRRMFDEGEADLRLRYRAAPPAGLGRVFAQYGKRLPTAWQRWLWWAHRCYEHAIPRTVPALIEAFEALIAIEAQLQVDGNHANRDHVVHQLADAELAVKLHTAAAPGFDDHDWDALCAAVPSARALDPSTRAEVTRCGLALAGLFHDVGYLRYVGDGARHALSTGFGLAAPGPSFDLWEVMRELAGTYLDHILSPGAGGSDGLVAELFAFAWENGWHGALSARLLISVGRKLRGEGRATPRVDAAIQIAAAAAFCHELQPVEPAQLAVPRTIERARERVQAYAWPGLFRIVDELQCWFRPELVPVADKPEHATLRYGAWGSRLSGGPSVRALHLLAPEGVSRKELGALRYLYRRQPAVFNALGVRSVDEIRRVDPPKS